MNHTNRFSLARTVGSRLALLLLTGALISPIQARAATVDLVDGNTIASVDFDSSAGMYRWLVDGQNQLRQQWFWYRVGNGLQAPINTISAAVLTPVDARTIMATYTDAVSQYSLDILYILTGGTLGHADLTETIQIHNLSGDTLDFHLFQYSDFDLAGTAEGDTASLAGPSTGGFDYALQQKSTTMTQIGETITSPVASRGEASIYPDTLNNLNTVPGYNLNNDNYAGPGNATWALQWDVSLTSGKDFYIFKDKLLSIEPIPEPSTLSFLVFGLGLWGVARRRQ
jgi:hypothetical protein